MTKPKQWDRHSILAELRRRNMTLLGLAELYGLSTNGFRNIWSRPHEKAERAIADFIGQPVEQVFNDRYPKTGSRILKQPAKSYTAHKRAGATRKAA